MPRTVVLCAGNPLMGDDGVGLEILERLRAHWDVDGADLVDGGTWGLSLLPVIEDADHLLIVDAIARQGGEPGTLVELARDELPLYLSLKISPHQVDLRDALALAEWRGKLPTAINAVGIRPAEVELRTALSPVVAAACDALEQAVIAQLTAWGHACAPRHAARRPAYA